MRDLFGWFVTIVYILLVFLWALDSITTYEGSTVFKTIYVLTSVSCVLGIALRLIADQLNKKEE